MFSLDDKTMWYLIRASGLVTWALSAATIVYGLMLSSKLLTIPRVGPRLRSVHNYLTALTVAFLGVHLATLVADNYMEFGWREILLPQASSYERVGVTWGVISLYAFVVVIATSLVKKKLPKKVWHRLHLVSFVAFVAASFHAFAAGTDVKYNVIRWLGLALTVAIVFPLVYRLSTARNKKVSRVRTAAALSEQ